MMLQAGLGGTAKQFYRRHHSFVVAALFSVTGIATFIAAILCLCQSLALVPALLTGMGAALAFLPAYYLTRHLHLALVTASAPLPGLIWAAPWLAGQSDPLVPILAYGIGFAAAALYAENKLARLLKTGPGAAPWLPPLALSLGILIALALIWFAAPPHNQPALHLVVDAVAGVASTALLLPLATGWLGYDEAFVVRANRAREARARRFERLGQLAVARWGLSFTGVAAVLIVLGWYGAHGMLQGLAPILASLALAALAGGTLGQGWREGVAIALAGTVMTLMLLWVEAVRPHTVHGAMILLASTGLYGVLALSGLWRTRCYRLRGEAPDSARGRVLEEAGGAVAGTAGALFALLPVVLVTHGASLAPLGLVLAGLAGLVFCPALVTGLEALVPRRRSLEELYGPRRRR